MCKALWSLNTSNFGRFKSMDRSWDGCNSVFHSAGFRSPWSQAGFLSIALLHLNLIHTDGVRKYRENKWGKCTNNVKLDEKVVIITGGNSGIGYEITKDLAARGAQVIIACRKLDDAAKAICRIKREVNCSSIVVPMELDLSSMQSIKDFAATIKATYSAVHVLINNAGVAYPNHYKEKTKDGFEIHMGINHLGHFLLTNLLLETLKNADRSRIVIISSRLHEKGKLNLEDLNLEKTLCEDPYASSKLANVYFGKELAKITRDTGINVYTVCPGWVMTNLFRHHKRRWYENILVLPIAFLYMRSPKQGAQTAIYCATEPCLDNETGFIYNDCHKYLSQLALADEISQKLWEVSGLLLIAKKRTL